jgi:hypothetical protein
VRTKLAFVALGVGVAAALLPLAPASANCDPDTGLGDGSCTNGCVETGKRYEALRAKAGHDLLPSYWDVISCPM